MKTDRTIRRGTLVCVILLLPVALYSLPTAETTQPAPETRKESQAPPLPAPSAPVVEIHESPPMKTVTVIGTGVVEAIPDIATVRIGVDSIAAAVDGALAENRKVLSRIISSLLELGIDELDIQMANYSFNFDRRAPEPAGSRSSQGTRYYRVNNMLTVVIRDLVITGDIIDAAVVGGANQLWGVQFDVADRARLDREALRAAALDASKRAQFIAELSGADLGEILSVSEVIGATPPALQSEAVGTVGENVHPGLMRFTSRLQVVYVLVSKDASTP